MATVVTTPVFGYTAGFSAQTMQQSTSVTATICCTGGFETLVGFLIKMSNVSADQVIKVYASNDGGTNFETNPSNQFTVPRAANAVVRGTFRLPGGIWAIQFLNSGPNSGTFQIVTQQVLSAYQNV